MTIAHRITLILLGAVALATFVVLVRMALINPLSIKYTLNLRNSFICQGGAGLLAIAGSMVGLWANKRMLSMNLFLFAIELFLIGLWYQLSALIAP